MKPKEKLFTWIIQMFFFKLCKKFGPWYKLFSVDQTFSDVYFQNICYCILNIMLIFNIKETMFFKNVLFYHHNQTV